MSPATRMALLSYQCGKKRSNQKSTPFCLAVNCALSTFFGVSANQPLLSGKYFFTLLSHVNTRAARKKGLQIPLVPALYTRNLSAPVRRINLRPEQAISDEYPDKPESVSKCVDLAPCLRSVDGPGWYPTYSVPRPPHLEDDFSLQVILVCLER